ncbi:MAG: folate-binding protein [Rhodanobacteraceae bacterium]
MMTDRQNPSCPAEILTLRGDDAAGFANAQLASKVDQLDTAQWQWTAWLGADGKVRLLGMLWKDNEGIHVLLRGGRAAQVRATMQAFVMRSHVELTASSANGLSPGEALPERRLHRDGETLAFGLGDYSLRLTQTPETSAPEQWVASTAHAIGAGHPWLPEDTLDMFLPPALGLYTLGAVTLGKGCYPGQEMANRLHRLGGHKHVLAHVQCNRARAAGEELSLDGQQVATILMHADGHSLLVSRQEALGKLPGCTLVRQFPG